MIETECMLFAAAGYRVLIYNPGTSPDGRFHHQIDLVAGPFQGTMDAVSYVDISALTRFRDSLVLLYRDLKGEAVLGEYDNFELRLAGTAWATSTLGWRRSQAK